MAIRGVQVELPFLRSENNYDREAASRESGLECKDLSLARQSEAEDADINVIVKRFGLTGKLPANVRMPVYGDFTGVSDYREAMEAVRMADESFMRMPADVRLRFHNDPAEFVDFVGKEENREEAIKLGLVEPKVEPVAPEPMLVKVVPEAPVGDSGKS